MGEWGAAGVSEGPPFIRGMVRLGSASFLQDAACSHLPALICLPSPTCVLPALPAALPCPACCTALFCTVLSFSVCWCLLRSERRGTVFSGTTACLSQP